MVSIAVIPLAFLCGSLPFSVWLGKSLLGLDVRKFGDGNPGAANAFRAGNKLVGLLVLLLDISKAAAPVGWAYFNLEIRGIPMVLIAVAPILGHVFSPFLHFRGGKAVAASLGVWIGLTIWKASLPAVVGALIGIVLFTPSGWSVMCAMSATLLVLLVWLPDPLLLPFLFAFIWLLVMFWEPLVVLALMISGLVTQAQPTAIVACLALSFVLWLIPYGEMRIPIFLAFLYPFTILANVDVAVRSLVQSLGGRITWKGRTIARTRWKWL